MPWERRRSRVVCLSPLASGRNVLAVQAAEAAVVAMEAAAAAARIGRSSGETNTPRQLGCGTCTQKPISRGGGHAAARSYREERKASATECHWDASDASKSDTNRRGQRTSNNFSVHIVHQYLLRRCPRRMDPSTAHGGVFSPRSA